MVKNGQKLVKIARFSIDQCKPENIFKNCLKGFKTSQFEKVVIISIGKAAKGMATAVIKQLKRKPDDILFADTGHPVPTEEGVKKTEKIIKVARALGEKDLAIVLISGGGSAMMACPAPGIRLEDKVALTKSLLRSGATINEINVVRKHISQVKGGQLATLLFPATVLGFVISDVVGNDLSVIASGPLSPDKSTFGDAIRILKKHKIIAPKNIEKYLEEGAKDKRLETPKAGEKCFKNVKIKVLADHKTAVNAASDCAKKMGLKVNKISEEISGEAKTVGRNLLQKCKPGTVLIAGGETTVNCTGTGFGGRNQEVVLGALPFLKPGQTILSIGTDGVDGVCPEEVAGAIGDCELLKKAERIGLRSADFLANNDSYSFFSIAGGLIMTGPTGTNLGDLILLFSQDYRS